MPKFKDGFQTTLGLRINTSKIQEALLESFIADNLLTSSLDVKKVGDVYPVFITALQDSEEKIPLFAHPYYLKTKDGREVLATDMRLYLKKNVFDGNLITLPKAVISQVEFNFARSRVVLNLKWLEDDADTLKLNLHFASAMFGRWMADVLSKAYALDGGDQIIVAIASSYYYQALFNDLERYDEEMLHKWRIHTHKTTNADDKTIQGVFENMPVIKGVSSLIEGIIKTTNNVRLKDLNIVSLLTLIKNSWYGTNSKDIIAIAVEHPPTWMAVVYAATSERSYRSSQIAKIVERVGKRGLADDYMKQYHKVVSEYDLSLSHQALIASGMG